MAIDPDVPNISEKSVLGTAYFIPFVDNAAHVGGLIGGAFIGYWLTPKLMISSLAQ